MGKKKEEEQGGGAPEWMVTFSDAMTLLMVFFILLFSMSTVDAKKEAQLTQAFNNIFNGGGNNPITNEGVGEDIFNNVDKEQEEEKTQDSLVDILNNLINEKGLEDFISVEVVERGVSVVVVDSLLFQSGRADLKGESKHILRDIADVLNEIDNQIIIEGHTDNVPINTYMFASNWELSTARSVVVTRFLVESANVNPVRISAQGYGEFRPIALNDTAENKAKNRRVNILILNKVEG
ncbi:OmpA/MotB family protein [Candidatus Arthromitus sp. SFB-rat-Yit]|uniref:OmpA/MotB family protein n=1 Tax=Candidatus Arthromitus sp. SFB-rat-Yit TaxID=1041504 RepID=UPI000227A40F|nr:flagellar motor protein MotB [Candidatus Arthromitus sp. SFB-rat-Yit]BAK81519.1 OmpA/MotB protein [Candidatus Arthromitus sp. SFB-rat-Yit]